MKILLGTDGSPAALHAVRHALALRAQGLPASFVLVNVQAPASLYEVVTAHDPEVIRRVRSGAGADLLAPAEALLQGAGAEFESEVAGGDAGHVLRELAEVYGCDAIVLGAAEGVGSVAQDVLEHSPVPVTLVRLPEE
jgi:nucleotide-binding universal stress UspA family protein